MKNLEYPYTLFPYSIERILKNDFDYPYVSLMPAQPKKQDKVKKDSYIVAFIGVIIFFLSGIFEFPPIMLASALLIIISFLMGASENKRSAINERLFNNQTALYQEQLFKHNKEIKSKNDFIKNLTKNDFKTQFTASKINEYFFGLNLVLDETTSVKGYSENYFSELLKDTFKECIVLTDKTINCLTKNPFSPDIILYDEKRKIYVDIEIDEPYTYIDKKPIHYLQIENDEFVHINSKRDNYFTDLGVVVIRFSELQILKTALGCVKYISDVMFLLTNSNYYLNLMDDYNFDEVLKEEFWLIDDSNKFIETKLRETHFFDSNGFPKNISNKFKASYKDKKNENNSFDDFDYMDGEHLPF